MVKVTFGSEFKSKSTSDFNKFSLDTGEFARICVFDAPEMSFVHTLRKVIIDDSGEAVMETHENKGRTWEAPKTDFVGKYLCLGDEDTLLLKGADPEACPACKAAQETQAVEEAKRRYAVNILHYTTVPGKYAAKTPFQVSCKAWEFSDNRFSSLVDIAEEQGDLSQVDLLIKCGSKQFQKLEITTGKGAPAYTATAETKKFTAEVIKSDRVEDLGPLMGRTVKAHELASFVKEVVDQWDRAFNKTSSTTAADDVADDSDLSAILGMDSAEEKKSPFVYDESDESESDEPTEAEEDDDMDVEDIESLLASLK